MVKMKQQGEQQDADKAGQDACADAGDNGFPVLPEKFNLLIQRHRKTDCRRSQKIADYLRSTRIAFIAHSEQGKRRNDQNDGHQQRVRECPSGLFL